MILTIILCSILISLAQPKSLFIRYSTQKQSSDLFSYFHDTTNGFFVDVGAYDPIYASNTLGLVGWKGINVEADRDRHQNFLISRPNEINLNLAITNQTGGYATLVEYAEDSSASIHADLLKGMAAGSIKSKEQTVYQMTLADLCHKYYIKRPKLLNIDIEEHGYVALSSNDWTTQRCVPEVILIQKLKDPTQNKRQRDFLESKFYTLHKQTQLNELYIFKQVLRPYEEAQKRGLILLEDMRVQYWFPLYVSIFKAIAPSFPSEFENFKHLDPRKSPVFIHFAQEAVISIERIRKDKKFASKAERPILIMHYNPLNSQLLLGSADYNLESIQAENQSLFRLTIRYESQVQTVYILDHQINPENPLRIIEQKLHQKLLDTNAKCQQDKKVTVRQKTVNVDNYIQK